MEVLISISFRLLLEPESIKERKKNVKENDFLNFDSIVENIKENQI